MIDFDKLKSPFPPNKVSWRVGRMAKDGKKAVALAYIDARDVMQRLDDVCGPAGWQCKYSHANGKTVCDIGIRVARNITVLGTPTHEGFEWVWKADGAGDSDIEAEKGALSDAFKRAAVRWGIGRYLYDMPAPWVSVDEFKHITTMELERLAKMLPNAIEGGVTVAGMNGLSKQPAKFWDSGNLILAIPKKYEANPDAAISWRMEHFKAGIDKAPSRDLLAKFQNDNADWIDKLPSEKTHEIYEACSVRAQQFDQFNGAA